MFAFGLGIGTINTKGDWLEVLYPVLELNPAKEVVEQIRSMSDNQSGRWTGTPDAGQLGRLAEVLQGAGLDAAAERTRQLARSPVGGRQRLIILMLEEDGPSASTPEVYLKLQLLSRRLKTPHSVNLEGIFALLPNVAWTSEGPIDLDELPERQLEARLAGRWLKVHAVDKFPPMADYVVPKGVRIGDASRVRLGAHLGEGTTIMHEGFVNFNAGTLGTSMIEGRISAGVVIGKGSDLGGGSSTMGTLSGGGNIVISVGENSLVGANAGIGIPLGDRCKVEAGLYLTAGTKVALLDDKGEVIRVVKARELAGVPDLVFRRNSLTGRVEATGNTAAIQLNEALHAHN